jgi:hypothetical protein
MNKLYTGIDISKNDAKIVILDQQGNEVTKRFAIDNNVPGAQILIETLVQSCQKLDITKVFVGYESTSVYGTPLQYFLADNLKLKPYNPSLICFNVHGLFGLFTKKRLD